MHFGARTAYNVYAQTAIGEKRRLVAKVPVREPAYMHSFAITENYVVLVEFPLVVNPLRLALGGKSFIESYRWRPERGTRVTVVDKRTGESRDAGTCAPMFSFHHVNAFERDGEIVLDLVAYDDASIIDRLFLSELRDGAKGANVGTLHRLRVPLAGGADWQWSSSPPNGWSCRESTTPAATGATTAWCTARARPTTTPSSTSWSSST